ncbi:MAG: serine protease [Jatrophihabitantaceae bacterium]
MPFLPRVSRRPFRLLIAAATAVAATALTVSTAVAAPAARAAAPAAPAAVTPATAAPGSSHGAGRQPHTVSLASMISLEIGCSASLVRYPSSRDTDRAMMLTNGHCWEGGFIFPDEVLVNQPSSFSGDLLNAQGQTVAKVWTDRLLYATMTGTDVALYRLTQTFAQIRHTTGLHPLTIASHQPVDGRAVSIPSGYWKIVYSCAVDAIVPTVREAIWTWQDSIRYEYPNSDCQPIGGTSGSPIIDNRNRKIVGINNTANEGGEACELNNPCEVNSDGSVTAIKGAGYGQETYWFTTCLTGRNTIDLNKAGCLLPKPLASSIR